MPRLILFRHAKAARHAGGGDHARPLEAKGQKAATRMGRWLAASPYKPDLAVTSDARRTRETLALAAQELAPGLPLVAEPRIYEASAAMLLVLLRETPDRIGTLLSVGHNPGFAEMALNLVREGSQDDMARLRDKFPTAAMAVIAFDLPHWHDVDWGLGRLEAFVTPAMLDADMDDHD